MGGIQDTYKARQEKYVLLNPEYNNEDKLSDLLNQWTKGPKQMELLLSYLHLQKTEGVVSQKELLRKSGASPAQLKGLADKKVLFIEQRQVDRLQFMPKVINVDFTLSSAQQSALDEITEHFRQKSVCLLHGVTSSGKTQVYIKRMEAAINEGRQVLYLLPGDRADGPDHPSFAEALRGIHRGLSFKVQPERTGRDLE